MTGHRHSLLVAADATAHGEFVRWTPARASAEPELRRAVEAFEPLDVPAGAEAAEFLKRDSLANDPSTRTHILVHRGRVDGFIALSNTTIRLTDEEVEGLEVIQRRHLPATLLAWVARHRESDVPGLHLVATAYGLAREAARDVGSVAFVLDPADAEVSEIWQAEPYGFRRSLTGNRLWTPLDVDAY